MIEFTATWFCWAEHLLQQSTTVGHLVSHQLQGPVTKLLWPHSPHKAVIMVWFYKKGKVVGLTNGHFQRTVSHTHWGWQSHKGETVAVSRFFLDIFTVRPLQCSWELPLLVVFRIPEFTVCCFSDSSLNRLTQTQCSSLVPTPSETTTL